MTLIAPRIETARTPRSVRLAALALPGVLLCLGTAAAVSIASAHVAIAHAAQTLLALH